MNVLLLAPKTARDATRVFDVRAMLKQALEKAMHRPLILEHEADQPGETLRQKFLRLAAQCEQAVLVWPPHAAMGTTADEIVLLQEVADARTIDVVLILHEQEAEQRGQEIHVHSPPDRSRYLDGILACHPFVIRWARDEPFATPLGVYVDAFLA